MRAELAEVEGEEPPPTRLVVADSRLLLLDQEPEDSYIGRRVLSDEPIVLSDDADEPRPVSMEVRLSARCSAESKFTVRSPVGEDESGAIDVDALAGDGGFIEEQRRIEALLAARPGAPATPTAPAASQGAKSTPPSQKSPSSVSPKARSRAPPAELRAEAEAAAAGAKKRAKTATPDPRQPTLFSFLTRSKSADLK